MIIILKKDPDPAQLDSLVAWLRDKGLQVHTSTGESHIVLGLVGDTASMDIDLIAALDIVESVRRVQEPYKKANRKFHPRDTVIEVAGRRIGGGTLTIMAGPCSVESEEQILAVAQAVKESGATMLRGGAFKPRTSPYSFQGKGVEGLRLLSLAKKATGLPIVTELMEVHQLEYFDDVDVIQVGARNMQNFNLLKELGKQGKPILLKRGMSGTIEEDGPQLVPTCDDSNCTRLERLLRCHHLDELPQLWNVLRGDMSIVGPRPERKYFADRIMAVDENYRQVYRMKPGLTSEATLYNGYTDTMEKMLTRLHMDLGYLERRSLWLDFKITARTARNIITGKKF